MEWVVFRDLAAGAGAIILLAATLLLGVVIDKRRGG
jgi:hypothetical protein